MSRYETIIIGAGLAGLVAACHLARANRKVLVLATGTGALVLASGGIDVLGYQPAEAMTPVKNPLSQWDDFLAERPGHPYRFVSKAALGESLTAFQELVNDETLSYNGSPERNWLLPTAAGAVHPTCLAPTALAKGELSQGGRLLIVGFRQLRDFYPALISQNLNEQNLGVEVAALTIDTPPIPQSQDMNTNPTELACAFQLPDFRREIINRVKGKVKGYDRIGFPAVLGIGEHAEVMVEMERGLDKPVFEIPTLPPSIPGRRLYDRLRHILAEAGGGLIIGAPVLDGTIEGGRVTQIRFESASRPKVVKAGHYILATGGIYGGGILTEAEGGIGKVWEPIFGLPVVVDTNRHNWFAPHFLEPKGQPFADYGVQINERFNPVTGVHGPVADNLYIAGSTIAGSDWTRGRTGEGVAVVTATMIANQILVGQTSDNLAPAG
jgi:glycerol-3-phosphate dehydrogenase subunit B